jgi:hypothetical protein
MHDAIVLVKIASPHESVIRFSVFSFSIQSTVTALGLFFAKARAVALPFPEVPPVIIAILPLKVVSMS